MAKGSHLTKYSRPIVSVKEPCRRSIELVGSGHRGGDIFAKIGKSVKVGEEHGLVVPIVVLHGGLNPLNFVQ